MTGLLSICIATRNRADRLAKHLSHISTFGELNFEVVVSDNNSDDYTPAVVDLFRRRLPGMHAIRQQETLNNLESISGSLATAAGDYMMFVADDDFLNEQGLLAAVRLMDSLPDVAAVYGAWEDFDDNTMVVEQVHQKVDETKLVSRDGLLALYNEQWCLELPVFRRQAYQRACPPLTVGMPLDFASVAAFSRHGLLAQIPETVVAVSRHPGQDSKTIYRDQLIHAYIADYEVFISHLPVGQRLSAANPLSRKLGLQYHWCSTRAREDGHYMLARQFLQRSIAHGGPQDEQAVRQLLDRDRFAMAGEMLSQLHRITRPNRALVFEEGSGTRAAVQEFARRHPDVELTGLKEKDFLARPHSEEELILSETSMLLQLRQRRLGHPLRKGRSLADLLAVCAL